MANSQQQYADPMLMAFRLVDDPSIVKKKGHGRPRKNASAVAVIEARKRGRPPGSMARISMPWEPRRSGRSSKARSVYSISNGFKRSPGRPRKVQPPNAPFDPAAAPVTVQQNIEAPSYQADMPNARIEAPHIPAIDIPIVPNININALRTSGWSRKNLADIPQVPISGSDRGSGRGHGRP